MGREESLVEPQVWKKYNLSLQREKGGIKVFIEHWGVYINEKYLGD